MKFIVLVLLLVSAFCLPAQDIDFYIKNDSDGYRRDSMNTRMRFEEYHLLSKTLRMKEMMYAMVVPGYIHFWAQDKKAGYAILGARLFAFGEMAYMGVDMTLQLSWDKWRGVYKEDGLSGMFNRFKNKTVLYSTLTMTSLMIIFGSYMYDWIHGQYRLLKKQNMIRYKYNMKLNLASHSFEVSPVKKMALYPEITLQYRF